MSAGWFESSIFDAESSADWKFIGWSESKPSGTSIVVKLRTSNDNDPYDGGWSDWYQHTNGMENTLMPDGRYVQYRVELSTADDTNTPEFLDILINYNFDNTPPPTPSLVSPANGANIFDTTPTFVWNDVSDPSGITYQIQVDDDEDFSSPVYDVPGLTESTYTVPDELALFVKYYWRVFAIDGASNISAPSDTWNFTVVPIGAIGMLLMPLLMLLPFALMLWRQNKRYHY
jgi:hypothetical protein